MLDKKTLDVTDPRRKPYKRMITTRPVTFICQECGVEVTEDLFPGAAPKYCNTCVRDVRKRQAAERVRRWRAQQREGR